MDINYLLILQELRNTTHNIFDNVFLYITSFGEDFIIIAIISGIYWCINKSSAIYLLFNFYIGNFINQAIKITACVYRPWIRDSRIIPAASAKPGASGYSFPSGHTAKAIAAWGGLAVYNFREIPYIRNFLLLLVFAVGFSRNYLGVHTPQDVIVSFILGVFILMGSSKLLNWVNEKNHYDWIITGIIVPLSIILVLYAKYKTYPLDYVDNQLLVVPEQMINGCFRGSGGIIGFIIGWLLDRKLIHYNEQIGTWHIKLFRYLTGMCGLILLYKTTPIIISMFTTPAKSSFINGFIIPFYITAIFPFLLYIFTQLNLHDQKHRQ